MISMLISALILAASAAGAPKPATASGLIRTSEMTVRAVVEDRCRIDPAGVTCDGAVPIRPLTVSQTRPASRIDVTF